MVNQVLQGLHRNVGVGNNSCRGVDFADAFLKKSGRYVVHYIGIGYGGDHVARLVVDTQVQAVAQVLAALTQREVQPDGLAFSPTHLAEGLPAKDAHKFHFVTHQPQGVGDVTCHTATAQGHLPRY